MIGVAGTSSTSGFDVAIHDVARGDQDVEFRRASLAGDEILADLELQVGGDPKFHVAVLIRTIATDQMDRKDLVKGHSDFSVVRTPSQRIDRHN